MRLDNENFAIGLTAVIFVVIPFGLKFGIH